MKQISILRNAAFIVICSVLAAQSLSAQVITQTFTYTGAIQTYTVPSSCVGTVTIQAKGAQGGYNTASTYNSGLGADITGVFTVTAGQVLKILVGQQPSATGGNGGGGGTFVTDLSNNPMVIAGGGGGSAGLADSPNKHGQSGTAGGQGSAGNNGVGGTGGVSGNGGSLGTNTSWTSAAGGGLLTDGAGPTASTGANSYGKSFINGGAGGTGSSAGGFGGGGSGSANYVGGGGGGYSGGGGGANDGGVGGGGGSYNGGSGQINLGGANTGHGRVIISYMLGTPIALSPASSSICGGSSATITASNLASYTWQPVGAFAGSNSPTISPSPSVTTTYSVQGTDSQGCLSGAAITVTVSAAAPVLTITGSAAVPTVCAGSTIALTASGALSYTWSSGSPNGSTLMPMSTTFYSVSGANGCGTSTAGITVTVSALPVTAAASNTLICSGTPATLTASGANTYTWSSVSGTITGATYIVNPLNSITYTLSGRSGVCSGSNTVFIGTKPNPTLSIAASSSVVCSGNSASLTVNGNAVSYTWNPGNQAGTAISVTPTLVTLYSVTGTNSVNCVSTANQVILVNPNPTVSASSSNPVVCSGGASTLAATGAASYTWTDGSGTVPNVVNPVSNTDYTVTGSYTTGCTGTATTGIRVFVPAISVSNNTAICLGGNALLNAGGAGSYLWSNNATFPSITVSPLLTTVYTVTGSVTDPVSNISCPATNSVTVIVNPNPTITATADHNVICLGNSAVLSAAGAGSAGTYTWTGGPAAVQAASISVSPIANQSYSVSGTDNNGCKGNGAVLVQVSLCTGINETSANGSLSIYPNPNTGAFTISSGEAITLYVINELGQQVRILKMDKEQHEARIEHLPAGVYIITGKAVNGWLRQKVMVME